MDKITTKYYSQPVGMIIKISHFTDVRKKPIVEQFNHTINVHKPSRFNMEC